MKRTRAEKKKKKNTENHKILEREKAKKNTHTSIYPKAQAILADTAKQR